MTETRTCRECGDVRQLTDFHINARRGDKVYRRHKCPDCYYQMKVKLRQRKRQAYKDFKKTLRCEECGFDDWRALQFHHDDKNKEANVADVVAWWSEDRLMNEIKKCRTLCANCHIILHTEQLGVG